MSALTKRLERGIEAIKLGDLDQAERLLDEVSVEPGSMEPIPGLLEGTQQRFEELRSRLLGDSWDDAEGIGDGTDDEMIGEDDFLDTEEAWGAARDDEAENRDDEADDPETALVPSWELDNGGCGCGGDVVVTIRDDEPGNRLSLSMEYVGDGALVEVERHQESFREIEFSADKASDTLVTVQSFNSSVTMQPGAEVPDVVAQNLSHEIDSDREWTECHVEELRVIRTTLVY